MTLSAITLGEGGREGGRKGGKRVLADENDARSLARSAHTLGKGRLESNEEPSRLHQEKDASHGT